MTRIITVLLALGAIAMADAAVQSVGAQRTSPALPNPQPVPEQPPAAATPPPEKIKPRDDSLSDTLSRRNGVLPPPQAGQGRILPPPAAGTTPVIPPPGTPGGNPQVRPK